MSEKTGWWSRATGMVINANGPWGGGGSGKGPDGDGGDSGTPPPPRNPWTQPPGSGKPRGGKSGNPFEDLQRQMKDRFGGGAGGSGGGRGAPSMPPWPIIRLGLILFVAFWLLITCVWRIAYNERGVVTRFGAYARTLEPGVGLTLPWPIETVKRINVTDIRELKIPQSGANFVLSGDQNILDLDYTVRWSIADPELYLFQMDKQEETIRDVAEAAMRAALSRETFSQAIGPGRGRVEAEVSRQMREVLASYRSGVQIRQVAIVTAAPPQEVNDAFRDVTAAQQEAESAINDARTYSQQVIKRAQGEAASFDKVYEQYSLAPGVTRRRMYYETMEEVLSKVDKTIVETPGVTPYLPLPELKRKAAAPSDIVVSAPAGDKK